MLPFSLLCSLELCSSSGRIEMTFLGRVFFASRDILLVDVTSSVIPLGAVSSLLLLFFSEPVPVSQPERYRVREMAKSFA